MAEQGLAGEQSPCLMAGSTHSASRSRVRPRMPRLVAVHPFRSCMLYRDTGRRSASPRRDGVQSRSVVHDVDLVGAARFWRGTHRAIPKAVTAVSRCGGAQCISRVNLARGSAAGPSGSSLSWRSRSPGPRASSASTQRRPSGCPPGRASWPR
jgi:hypothetical protein